MYRTLTVFAVFAAVAVFAPRTGAAPPLLKPGEELKGELTDANKLTDRYAYTAQFANGTSGRVDSGSIVTYGSEFSISLKAGETPTATATVVGKDRGVFLVLIDPSGKPIDGTDLRSKTAKVTFGEVSATGTYRLAVVSDRIGDFTLRITGPSEGELDIKALEEKIAKLKQELAEAEAQLKKAKAKK